MTINMQKLRAFRQSLKRCASNTGHGHVYMRPDGFLAKCGGPGICVECAKDLELLMSTEGYEPPTTDDLIDTIDAQAAEIARLRDALERIISLDGQEDNEWDAVERLIPEMMSIARSALLGENNAEG